MHRAKRHGRQERKGSYPNSLVRTIFFIATVLYIIQSFLIIFYRNVVAKVDLGCPSIDLKKLFNGGHRYRALGCKKFTETVTFFLPHSTAIGRIFRTGKMNVMGAKSEKEVLLAARQLTRIIQKSGFPVNSIIAVIVFSYYIHHNSLL